MNLPEPARPHLAVTRTGHVVHRRAADHLPAKTRADRFNKWLAIKVTTGVGTMWCAYLFCAIALTSLPAAIGSGNVTVIVAWLAQTFIQLVLLSVIIVGQNIQTAAGDARTEHMLELAVSTADAVDVDTAGGLRVVVERLNVIEARLPRG